MGMDASAGFGYGLKVTNKKLIDKINEDELDLDKDLDVIFHGSDCHDGESENLFVCIKKSSILIFNWDDPKFLKPDKFIIQDGWNEKLIAWAKEHKISKPKIGWWLCCSYG